MEEIISIVTKYFSTWLCGILAGAIAMMWRKINQIRIQQKEEDEAIKKALVAMIRKDLLEMSAKYIEAKSIPLDAKEVLDELFTEYFTLGGDGAFHAIYEEIKRLTTDFKPV